MTSHNKKQSPSKKSSTKKKSAKSKKAKSASTETAALKAPTSRLLVVGKKAPTFKLKDKSEKNYKLSDFDSEYVVIFFYPKDNTPGCTIESKSYSKALARFERLDAAVIGISGGDAESKEKFCKKQGLKTLHLSDPDFAVSEKYGVYGEKKFLGRKYLGINRITYILDAQKRVLKVFDKVNPLTHVEEVLDFLNQQSEA